MPSARELYAATLVAAAFIVPLCPTTTLGAQQAPAVGAVAALPQRVRLRLPEAQLKGLAVEVADDSLLLQTTDGSPTGPVFRQRWVPLDCVERAEVSVGRRSRWRGTLLGGAYGLLVGVGAGVIVAKNQERPVKYPLSNSPIPATDNQRLLRTNVAWFGTAGLVLGGGAGFRLPTERWQRVDPRTMLGPEVDPPGGRLLRRGCRRIE